MLPVCEVVLSSHHQHNSPLETPKEAKVTLEVLGYGVRRTWVQSLVLPVLGDKVHS
jgi:hypothetical protein